MTSGGKRGYPGAVRLGGPTLEEAFEKAVAGMAILDLDGRFAEVNPALCRMAGRGRAELVGLRPDDITHPDDRSGSAETLAALLSGESRALQARKRYLRPDGSVVVAERTVTSLLDDDGRIIGLLSQIVDVTAAAETQAALSRSEKRFRALVDNQWHVVTAHDETGRFTYCSPAVTKVLGYRPEELLGRRPEEFVRAEDIDVRQLHRELVGGGRHDSTTQYRFRHANGSWRWLESNVHNGMHDPAIAGLVVTSRDVTQSRRQAAQQVALANLSRDALGGCTGAQLIQRAVDLTAEALDSAHCQVFRLHMGRFEVVASAKARAGAGPFHLEQHGPSRPGPVEVLLRRQSLLWEEAEEARSCVGAGADTVRSGAAAVILDGNLPYGVLTVGAPEPGAYSADDVSYLEAAANVIGAALGRERMDEELRRRAVLDPLTGLANRAGMERDLDEALARSEGRGVGVMFVDLDDFKLVNDTLGHAAGDRVIVTLAARISAAVRTHDVVARFGGDEFVVVCEDVDRAAVVDIAERVRAATRAPVEVAGRSLLITASIGVALAESASLRADDLLSRADIAMFDAKQAGKDRSSVFERLMQEGVSNRVDTITGLRRALAEGELRVLYQPLVEVATGEIRSHEALIRWDHPTEGLLGPSRFIPYAETSGLILPVGAWVLEEACRQSARWSALGRPAVVGVNVSPVQLGEPGFAATVCDVIARTGADPNAVILEITESSLADKRRASRALSDLKRLGLHIALDDFGTGYSSLSYLAEMPFDLVKIDRSFVTRVEKDPRAAAFLESIAAMCRSLDITTVAEGVETAGQLDLVRKLGIAYAQGYLVGRPGPADRIRRGPAAARPKPSIAGQMAEGGDEAADVPVRVRGGERHP